MKAILERRSIRKYTGEPVAPEQLETLLKAAMAAPSAGNEQPWHFVVIDDRDILFKITDFHPYSQMLKQAPLAIAVCGDMEGLKYEGFFWAQDCSAATENMLIAATEMGLGTVWLGVYPLKELVAGVKDILKLPDNITPFCLVAVGHPVEKKAPADRFDRKRIHKNGW